MGKADRDSDSTTACEDCIVGEYCGEGFVNPIVCVDSGAVDADNDPSTPCATEGAVQAVEAEVTLDVDIEYLASMAA
ncbi:MAG: hypothetical protein VXX04_05240, partial [Actinomycetota bacterium]|nr:hypothetical protein [Actinomycetota bacterium]